MPPFSISETLVYEGHSAEVTSVAFSPDGKHIASGSNDQTLRVWDSDSTIPPSSPLEGHTWGVKSICFSPDGNQLVSGSADSTLRLWNANDKTAVSQPLKGHSDSVGTVAFSPNSNTIASGSNDRTIRLWDAQEAKCISEPLEGHSDWVKSVAFSPSNTWVASGSDDCTIKIWDTSSKSLVAGPLQGHTWGINSVAFSPDGLYLISGSQDHSIRIWDVRNSKLVNTPFEGHAWWVTSVAFAPNGEYIVSGSRDCTARTWDARDGTAAFESFEHTSWVNSVAFSPCSTRIVLGLEDSKVVIRNLSNNEPGHSDDEGSTEYTSEFSSEDIPVRDMFDTLLAHGCVDLSSQLVPEKTSAMPIAGGGFGDIWAGYLQDGSEVAIKTWRMTAIEVDGAKPLKRAMRELYYWSKLSHENVHKLMGVIMFQDRYLGMVSQWMSRGSLRQYIRQHPQADRYSLVASGLSYLHSVKMIHGDLKAMNILVSSEGVAKLSDFDHSIMSNCSLSFSQTGSARAVGGTYRWMAPELFNGTVSTKDDKTDVYALGMTLLEIITGAVPYPKHQDAQVLALVMNRTLPTRSTKHFPDNGRDNHLWELLVRCWSHEPKDRPNAAEALEVVQFIMTLTI